LEESSLWKGDAADEAIDQQRAKIDLRKHRRPEFVPPHIHPRKKKFSSRQLASPGPPTELQGCAFHEAD
jgi:hypothetical protein